MSKIELLVFLQGLRGKTKETLELIEKLKIETGEIDDKAGDDETGLLP